ncbi:putative secreted effector protein [Golovinomyces cichoracearum]|uniref:Putative secreted effector protein n=1 Tax=Golovinomyces cichoracearum TaxID=62708 RepID=A0A420HK07_9PEZI|nr:putative secreted effector protein [Golovinomyces cichoracearum]
MRFFLAALSSSILLLSTHVHSHIVTRSVSPRSESKSISIYVQIINTSEKPGKGGECDGENESCSDTDSSKDEEFWTGDGCKDGESPCSHRPTYRYGFRCNKKFFNQGKVIKAAKAACPKIGSNSQIDVFPAPYTESEYKKPGPYVEWPIVRNGRFWNIFRRNKYRIVMTYDCTVVGAVIRRKKGKPYTQCIVERH